MSASRPFTDAHAIARLDFALVFSEHLAEDLRNELQAGLRELLPEESFEAEEDNEDGDSVYALVRKGEDGEITEAVHVHAHYVHVVWFDYRGWSFSRDEAIKRLQPALNMVRSGRLNLTASGLAYRDVFFNDDPSAYSADDVFRRDSRYLAPMAFDSGGTWRHWLTWMEATPGAEFKSYSSLGIDARVLPADGEKDSDIHVTDIAHRQQIVGNKNGDMSVEWSDENLARAWDAAHEVNHKVISGLLTTEMLKRIGLAEDLT